MNSAMHIVLHLVLCTAAVHGARPVRAVHVELDTRIGTSVVDRVIPVSGDSPYDTIVDLDAPRGLYLMEVNEDQSACGATQFVDLLPQANRSISLKLTPNGLRAPTRVPTLFGGSAPLGFDYTQPTIVFLPGTIACNQPIGDLLVTDSQTENDPDSYYTSLFGYTAQGGPPKVALRITDNAGGYHYIRLRLPFPPSSGRWPNTVHIDVTANLIDEVVGKPEDTFLCLKMHSTSVNG
jgi:hypothetical protein